MSMQSKPRFCGSPKYAISRRHFLAGFTAGNALVAGGMTSLDLLRESVLADEIKKNDKRVILLWLAGGASQLETWDPKPGRPTGGPFRAIPTSAPGLHISELLPQVAKRMQHTAVIRSLNTHNGDHGGASKLMHLGRRDESALKLPDLGAMVARELCQADSQVPDYVAFYTATEGRSGGTGQAGFYGARYAPMFLTNEAKPDDLSLPVGLQALDQHTRADLRQLVSRRFEAGRQSSSLASHGEAFARVQGLMSSEKLFDISQEPEAIRAKYGPTLFGQQALIARRLVEAGTPFVKVSRAWWDSHGQNFETHLELVTELDQVMSALLDDLADRGLLENTLVITLSEFGRTPAINASLGRDHFAAAWSATLSGCGIHGGALYGKTDEDGQHVSDKEIGAPQLFATVFRALGIDHQKTYSIGPRPIPLTETGTEPITELIV